MRLLNAAAHGLDFKLGRAVYTMASGGVIELEEELGRIAMARGLPLQETEEPADTEPTIVEPEIEEPVAPAPEHDEAGPDIAAAVESLAAQGVTLPKKKRR